MAFDNNQTTQSPLLGAKQYQRFKGQAGVIGYLLMASMMMAGLIAAGGTSIKSLTQVTANVSTTQQTQIDLQQNRALLSRYTDHYNTGAQLIKIVKRPLPWTPNPSDPTGATPKDTNPRKYLKHTTPGWGCGRMPMGRVNDGWGNPFCLIAFHPDPVERAFNPDKPEYETKTRGYHQSRAAVNQDDAVLHEKTRHMPAFALISAGQDGEFAQPSYLSALNSDPSQTTIDLGNTGDDLVTFLSFESLATTSQSTRLEVATGLTECQADEVISYLEVSPGQIGWECKTMLWSESPQGIHYMNNVAIGATASSTDRLLVDGSLRVSTSSHQIRAHTDSTGNPRLAVESGPGRSARIDLKASGDTDYTARLQTDAGSGDLRIISKHNAGLQAANKIVLDSASVESHTDSMVVRNQANSKNLLLIQEGSRQPRLVVNGLIKLSNNQDGLDPPCNNSTPEGQAYRGALRVTGPTNNKRLELCNGTQWVRVNTTP